MVFVAGWVTVICEFDCSVPAACALARMACTAAITSACWFGERLAQARCPRKVMRQVVEHRRKLRQRLDARVPRLLVDSLRERRAGQVLVLREPVVGIRDWCGFVAAARTCATSASGYRAMGATSASSCSADSGAGAGAELPLVVVETGSGWTTYSGCAAY